MTRPNSVTTNYSYDNLSRLLSVLHQVGDSTIDGEVYTVDSAGNRTSKADQLANVTTNYGYDAIYELSQATQGGATTESYSYDPVGNRLSSLGVSSYTTNTSNEVTAAGGAMYTYDYNGNTTSKTNSTGTTSYTWDYENRLASVTLPNSGGTVTFKYDPLGRRIYKESPNATSIFLYDGDDLVETVNSAGSTVARYTPGPNIDEPLAMQRGTTTDYYEADGLGSVTSLTASNGTVAQSYAYDSFGNTTNSTGSLTNFFRYTAREFDTETGLYFYRARYYDPTAGRFASEDPLLFGGGDPNFYVYVDGDPVDYTDITGTDRTCHIPSLCGPDLPAAPTPTNYTPTNALPPGSVQYTTPSGHTYWVPPSVNWCKEFAAAQKNGLFSISAVGQGGPYDYQRDPTTHTFYQQYTPAANFSVGVYMKGAGYPRWTTYAIGFGYGITHSSNYGWKGASRWAQNWGEGWDVANSGAFSNPNCGCN